MADKYIKWIAAVISAAIMACGQVAWAAVDTIEVIADVTGTSPQDAQVRALEYAQKRAFFLSLHKLDPDRAYQVATSLSDQEIAQYIRGYEIAQERYLENNRYQALVNVSLSDVQLRQLLNQSDKPAAPLEMNALLVLPVLDDGEELYLWEGDNIWRSIWNSTALQKGEGKLVLPYGDPTDVQTVDASNVLSRDFETLRPLAERYGAKEVVIVLATYEANRQPPGVLVTTRRLGPATDRVRDYYFEAKSASAPPSSVLVDAATASASVLREAAMQYATVKERSIAQAESIPVSVDFMRLSDWVQVQETMKDIDEVIDLQVGQISIQNAKATLFYTGSLDLLARKLQQQGLRVTPQAGGWSIAAR